jgi:hypothetical protein
MDHGENGIHQGRRFCLGKVLLPTQTAESVEQVLYCLPEFNLTAVCIITITMVTIIRSMMIHRMVMTMATIVVLLLLFNRMMNVISTMDNFDANAISPQEVTMLFESMNAVAVMVMNLTAEKQKSIILFSMAVTILPAQNCKGLYLWRIIWYG